jgi:hypothetical protein
MPTQIIVVIVLLAIFALTSLLNRDSQPLPQRPVRGKGPGEGDGDGRMMLNRAGDLNSGLPARRMEMGGTASGAARMPSGERPFTGRWAPPTGPTGGRLPGSASSALDDGIRILEEGRHGSGTRGTNIPNPPPRKERTGLLRRGQRGRGMQGTGQSGLKPIDHERPKALEGLTEQAALQKRAKPLTASPLAFPMAPINGPLNQISADSVVEFGKEGRAPAMSENQIRNLVSSPARLREMMILNVILQPPLCMQSPEGRGRRRV